MRPRWNPRPPIRRLVVLVLALLEVGCGGGSGANDGPAERCGDGRIDASEQCDGADLDGKTCTDFQFDPTGTLRCHDDCTFDLSACLEPLCGNDVVDRVGPVDPTTGARTECEACDGGDLGGRSCEGFGGSGNLPCVSCQTKRQECDDLCGNSRLDGNEPCDADTEAGPVVRGGLDCASLGLGEGPLGCAVENQQLFATGAGMIPNQSCILSPFFCSGGSGSCGDGIALFPELCDGEDLSGLDCASFGLVGQARCAPNCAYDLSGCIVAPGPPQCGNGKLEAGEECDGWHIVAGAANDVCGTVPLSEGVIVCTALCKIDREACMRLRALSPLAPDFEFECENGIAEGNEECDLEDLRGTSCGTLGGSGTLRCTGCRLDRAGCHDVGGNGVREGNETCDVAIDNQGGEHFDLGGKTCDSLGLGGGELRCGVKERPERLRSLRPMFGDPVQLSRFDTDGCEHPSAGGIGLCGDGFVSDDEECEGDQLAGASCATFNGTGDLRCTAGCQYDLSACRDLSVCGNGRVEFGEECEPADLQGESCAADGGVGSYACDGEFCFIDRSRCSFLCSFDASASASRVE